MGWCMFQTWMLGEISAAEFYIQKETFQVTKIRIWICEFNDYFNIILEK